MPKGKGYYSKFVAGADSGPKGMTAGASAESPRKAFLKKVKGKKKKIKTNAKAKSA